MWHWAAGTRSPLKQRHLSTVGLGALEAMTLLVYDILSWCWLPASLLEPPRMARAEDGLIYTRQLGSPRASAGISAGCLSSHHRPGAQHYATTAARDPSPDPTSSNEMCHLLNAIFLFRKLRGMAPVRNWAMNKIKAEFEKLLQTKLTGKVLEELSFKDIYLGNILPIFKAIRLIWLLVGNEESCPEELSFE